MEALWVSASGLKPRYAMTFLLLFRLLSNVSAACYHKGKAKTCITPPINAALNRKITASNTCGDPKPEGYCYIGPQRKCQICNKNNPFQNHSASYLVDRFNPETVTWWQSQTWWTSNQLGLSKMFQPLKVNISLSLNKKYLISGGIYVIFYTERPKRMIIERSSDFGKTWKIYQYYAKNCRSAYNMHPKYPSRTAHNKHIKQICSEQFSGEFPRTGGIVRFDPRKRYRTRDYFKENVQRYLEATDIRLRLEYPGTDGREYINEEAILNQYYYAISDIRVDARCNCNGHAEFCDNVNGVETCDCQHHTMGVDCEMCQPLYRNRVWKPGNGTHANPCEQCQCHDHATSCTYNAGLKFGVCHNCIHKTRGARCDQCVDRYYRNGTLPLHHPEVCIPCDCYQPGITDDGRCLQVAIGSQVVGQCHCKVGILGRRCDQCIPGKWGFVKAPIGTCFDCGCNVFGVLNSNLICDQYTGDCSCKSSITGRQCDRCKDGYYNFPSDVGKHCEACPCNIGGSKPSCDQVSGICTCKPGISGPMCDQVKPGHFFPNLTYIKYEPELLTLNGTSTDYTLVRNFGRFYTGCGFARLDVGQKLSFEFTVPTTADYYILMSYSLYQLDWYYSILPQGREKVDWSGSTDHNLYLKLGDEPSNWLFWLQVKNATSNEMVNATTFSIRDLHLGDANTWITQTGAFFLEHGEKYELLIDYQEGSKEFGMPWPLLIDSFSFMLDFTTTRYYTTMSVPSIRDEIAKCHEASRSLSTMYSLPLYCAPHIFTIDTELYDETLPCNCYQSGTLLFTSCKRYGGQCHCKNGYGGRRCDQCIPGFYGNPSTGCAPCSCSAVGSLSLSCDKELGLCACKKNAHGRRCNECILGFFDLNEANPKGCQECFGYGHSRSCVSAKGFVEAEMFSHFLTAMDYDGWTLMSAVGVDQSTLLIKTKVGMEYTDQTNEKRYFNAPPKFLGNQLYSYGQLFSMEMNIYPIFNTPVMKMDWHVRLLGNKNKQALFRFLEDISADRKKYTIRIHEAFLVNPVKMSEFDFKSLLSNLSGLHIAVSYFKAPVRLTVKSIRLTTAALYQPGGNLTKIVRFVEHSLCEKGYVGYSCEHCDEGYTRLIPHGGPLVSCVPCSCSNRSRICDREFGVCKNCKSGSTGDYCEKCMPNVLPPNCDQCKPGFYGLYTQLGGCKPCNCYLPGTHGGQHAVCNPVSGQCRCNSTLNVGGRQCNLCKENAFNISLSDNLRCQECPVCYGLIENSILGVRTDFLQVKIVYFTIKGRIDMMEINPFFQAISSMKTSVQNLTVSCEEGKASSRYLMKRWARFDAKINHLYHILSVVGKKGMIDISDSANVVFQAHNKTIFQIYYIRSTLTKNFYVLNETVQANIKLQGSALTMLKQQGEEMRKYVSMVHANANKLLKKKYELAQKIRLSINAASRAVQLAADTRVRALNLSGSLSPILSKGVSVEAFAEECVVSIRNWEKNATIALNYVNSLLSGVKGTVAGYAINVTQISNMYSKIDRRFKSLKVSFHNLKGKLNSVTTDITKLKTSLHLTQVDSVRRRSSLYITNLKILKGKTDKDIGLAVKVKSNALDMLNTVQNFMEVTQTAQTAANKALTKVDVVRTSVERALATAVSISNQLQRPVTSAASALDLMRAAKRTADKETKIIDDYYSTATTLYSQTLAAIKMIEGNEVKTYIENHLNPLLSKCTTFKIQTHEAFSSAKSALVKAQDAYRKSLITKQQIIILTANSNKLNMLDAKELIALGTINTRVKEYYSLLNVTGKTVRLRASLKRQNAVLEKRRRKRTYLKSKIELYRRQNGSLRTLTCNITIIL